ncbi:MAG: helix-turn-helix domain-containing protein [Deltaproteobacteria bacterium]|nr:helix-turn-helix domain-containing protein [Deltaproteobacteria bacterium]
MANETVEKTEDETLWTPQDAARYLCTSVSWVYHAAQRGELPCLRFSRMLRFDPAAIRNFARGKN